MKTAELKVNKLPAATWNWLKVNESQLDLNLENYKRHESKEVLEPQEGIKVFKDITALEAYCDHSYKEIESGMGTSLSQFMAEEAEHKIAFAIEPYQKISKPLVWVEKLQDQEAALEDDFIYAQPYSEATIIFIGMSEAKSKAVYGSSRKLYIGQGAKVKLIQIQLLGGESLSFNDIGSVIEKDGQLEIVDFEFGGSKVYSGCRNELLGEASSCELQSSYLGHRQQKIDMNYNQVHKGSKTNSQMHIEGLLLDESSKVLRATIDFVRGCKKAVGSENEEVLLLSPDIQNKTIPLILCNEEDVEGNHGAAIGELDEGQKFYLMSRGLSSEEAERLLMTSKIEKFCQKVPDESIQKMVRAYCQEVIKDE